MDTPALERHYTPEEPMGAEVEKPVWTVKDVAEYLRISERTVTHQAKEGKLPGKQVGSQWRFDAQRVKALLS